MTVELDLRQLARIARRWWWFLLLAPTVAGASAFIAADRQEPLYSASVVLRINPPTTSTLDVNAVRLSQELSETYRTLITFTPVMDRVIETLALPYTTEELEDKISATTVSETQLVRVSVSDPDPDQAALIADTIASEFSLYVIEEAQAQLQNQVSGLNTSIADQELQLTSIESQLVELDQPTNDDNSQIQAQIRELEIERTQVESLLTSLRQQSQAIASAVTTSQVQVSVSEPASPPGSPYAPRVAVNTLLGVFIGLLIAVGAIALLEYMDNSVKGDTDYAALAGTPLLTTIGALPNLRPGGNQVYVVSEPRSPSAEAIRMLRANLEFAAAGKAIKSLTVSSSGPGEGKSTTSANLAVVMAQAGLRTVLVDADLRKPSLHKIFGTSNDTGLTRLLTHPELRWQDAAIRVAVPNLSMIPSGPLPPNPSDLLSIEAFPALLARIAVEADIIVIDTPPVLAVSDPLVVGRHTDAILLVAKSGQTRRDALRHSAEALQQGKMRLLGIVLNQQRSKDGVGYYYYEGYGAAANPAPTPGATKPSPSRTRSESGILGLGKRQD
jgi:non-specific protein-tyrosine kinase